MKTDCIARHVGKLFANLGKVQSRWPLPFLVMPIILSVGLGIGFMRIKEETSTEYLYTPTDGLAKEERRKVYDLFPMDDSMNFVPSRVPHLDGYVNVIIERKGANFNLLNKEYFNKILEFDKLLQNITIEFNGDHFNFTDLCVINNGKCIDQAVLHVYNFDSSNIKNVDLTYPVHGTGVFLGLSISGLKFKGNSNIVKEIRVIQLMYNVRTSRSTDKDLSDAWLNAVKNFAVPYYDDKININVVTSLSLDEELLKSSKAVIPLFSITYTIICTFSITSVMMRNWVRSKPLLGVAGVVSSGLAIVSAMGIIMLIGVEFISVVASMPFLITGIGVDDMFIMIAAWRQTDYRKSVDKRMEETMREAGTSITLSSLTNILAFGVGAITTFNSVRIFCIYSGTGILFAYIYVITFFAACMVLDGRREEKHNHGYAVCLKAKTLEECDDENKGCFYRFWCAGGRREIPNDDTAHPSNESAANSHDSGYTSEQNRDGKISPGHVHMDSLNTDKTDIKGRFTNNKAVDKKNDCQQDGKTEHMIMNFFENIYGPILMKKPVQVIAILVWLGYLGVAIWGCTQLREGLRYSNLAPDSSYVRGYHDRRSEYFNDKFGPRVMVNVITDNFDYSDESNQKRINNLISEFQNSQWYKNDLNMVESWLTAYRGYLNVTSQTPSNLSDFINILHDQFLQFPGLDRYKLDINFSDDNKSIKASRFMVQTGGLRDTNDEKNMLLESRRLASESDLDIFVYHPAFIFYDQYISIFSNTFRNMGIAVACVVVIALILVPHPLCVVWIALVIVSICTGVMGYMTLWAVNLNAVSMINIILCVGFSVDYSAHVAYHYVAAEVGSSKERAIDALCKLGLPVLQGAISTILGVVVLASSDSYIFRTFFKTMFLVILFGACHALVFLPVVLSVCVPGFCLDSKNNNGIDPKTDKAKKIKNDIISQEGEMNKAFEKDVHVHDIW